MSCLKQTLIPTLALVASTRTKTPEEVNGVEEVLVGEAAAVAKAVVEQTQLLSIRLKGKLKMVAFPK